MLSWFKGNKKQNDDKKKEESKEEKEIEQDDADTDDVVEEEELEAKGFDPVEALADLKDREDECITDFSKVEYANYLDLPNDKMIEIMLTFKYGPSGEIIRHEEGHKKGGRICSDQKIVVKSRSAGKEIIKLIGKKILSGNLNLTQVSFPIRVMVPKTALETAVHATAIFPLYISRATYSPDHLERFKLVITAIISSFYWTNTFLKPLNPILGETLQASYNDGTEVYVEQIAHHPPISYFLIIGPNRMYKYFGYYLVEAKAWLNSLTILSKGKRSIIFKDGQRINFDFPNELYSGTFVGSLRQESVGKITFQDKENGLFTQIEFGKIKKQPSDFFMSDILQDGKKVSTVHGTYLGYIDFDDQRYWDYRTLTPYRIKMNEKPLASDHRFRQDLRTLREGNILKAQEEKERLEVAQRHDRKLREAYARSNKK